MQDPDSLIPGRRPKKKNTAQLRVVVRHGKKTPPTTTWFRLLKDGTIEPVEVIRDTVNCVYYISPKVGQTVARKRGNRGDGAFYKTFEAAYEAGLKDRENSLHYAKVGINDHHKRIKAYEREIPKQTIELRRYKDRHRRDRLIFNRKPFFAVIPRNIPAKKRRK